MSKKVLVILAAFFLLAAFASTATAKPLYCQYQCADWNPGDYNYYCTCPVYTSNYGMVIQCSEWQQAACEGALQASPVEDGTEFLAVDEIATETVVEEAAEALREDSVVEDGEATTRD